MHNAAQPLHLKKTKRPYSLTAIRDAVQSQGLAPPALITLKKWSQDGRFEGAATLEQAILVVSENFSPRQRTLPAPSASTSTSPGQAVATNIADEVVRSVAEAVTAVLDKFLAETRSQSNDVKDDKLATAINQLDALRRHLSLRFDSELQLVKQNHGQMMSGNDTAHKGTDDFLDIQRLQARLGRLEGLVSEIHQHLIYN